MEGLAEGLVQQVMSAGWAWEAGGAEEASGEELFTEGEKHCGSFGYNCSVFAKYVIGKQLYVSSFGASPV